eukprot:scaffold1594_cov401-Prasinococcus_capsulatus_cf.AAC.8
MASLRPSIGAYVAKLNLLRTLCAGAVHAYRCRTFLTHLVDLLAFIAHANNSPCSDAAQLDHRWCRW